MDIGPFRNGAVSLSSDKFQWNLVYRQVKYVIPPKRLQSKIMNLGIQDKLKIPKLYSYKSKNAHQTDWKHAVIFWRTLDQVLDQSLDQIL